MEFLFECFSSEKKTPDTALKEQKKYKKRS